jgi:hypothetical protein
MDTSPDGPAKYVEAGFNFNSPAQSSMQIQFELSDGLPPQGLQTIRIFKVPQSSLHRPGPA